MLLLELIVSHPLAILVYLGNSLCTNLSGTSLCSGLVDQSEAELAVILNNGLYKTLRSSI